MSRDWSEKKRDDGDGGYDGDGYDDGAVDAGEYGVEGVVVGSEPRPRLPLALPPKENPWQQTLHSVEDCALLSQVIPPKLKTDVDEEGEQQATQICWSYWTLHNSRLWT